MSYPVIGNLVTLLKHTTAGDVVFAGAKNCQFTSRLSLKEVTNYSSQNFQEFKPDLGSWDMSCDGLVILGNQSYAQILNDQLNRTLITVKFMVDNGADGLFVYFGYGYFTSVSLASPYDGLATYQVTIQGTGAFSVTGSITPITGSNVQQIQYTASGGETVLTNSALVGKTLLYMSIGGIDVGQINTSGSPSGTTVVFNNVAGTISIDPTTPLALSSFVRILYQ